MGKEIGHHEGFRRDHDAKIGSERNFGLTIGTICAVVALIRWYNHEWDVDWLTATLIASALGLVGFGLIWPTALKPLNIIWMRFGLLLYRVINPLALGLIFFVAVTPVGLIMRLLGKRPLAAHASAMENTYWIKRDPPGPEPKSMADQF